MLANLIKAEHRPSRGAGTRPAEPSISKMLFVPSATHRSNTTLSMRNFYSALLATVLVAATHASFAQNKTLAVGTATPNDNAALHVESPTSNQGIIIPRLTTAQRTSFTGALNGSDVGLIVFDTDLRALTIWNGGAWDVGMKTGEPITATNAANTGHAGLFENTNAANTNPTVIINKTGAGNALTANAPIQATSFVGDGSGLTNMISDSLAADAVKSISIQNGAITNADVNASAGIAGTKIDPDFGAQNIATTGTVTATAFAGDGSLLSNIQVDSVNGLGPLATLNNVGSVDISDNSITNDDVFSGAAIAGTKISPDFGAQNIATTGSVTATAFAGDGSALTGIDEFPIPYGANQDVPSPMLNLNNTNALFGTAVIQSAGAGAYAIEATSSGLGAISAQSTGTGAAGVFSSNSASTATLQTTNAGGPALNVTNISAVGPIAYFNNSDAGNGTDGILISIAGTGNAISANAPIQATSFIGDGSALTNVIADSARTNSVTSDAIADLTIENKDILPGAGIFGSKIDPNFGAQAIVTTGSITGGTFNGNGSGLTNLNSDFGSQTVQTTGILGGAEIAVDNGGSNTGDTGFSLHFGSAVSGEAIGSKRDLGTGQFGLDFYTATTKRMTIANTGEVGIGTPTPSSPLDVRTTATPGTGAIIAQFGSVPGSRFEVYDEDIGSSLGPIIRFNASFPAQIKGEGHIALMPGAADNVGIGTTLPTEQLEVIGNVKATQFIGDGSLLTGVGGGLTLPFLATDPGSSNSFDITNTGGGNVAVFESSGPSGEVGRFIITDSANGSDAVVIQTTGIGNAIYAFNQSTSGSGIAAQFDITDTGNASPAVSINHSGTGNAITANAPIQATQFIGDGSQLTNIMPSGIIMPFAGATAPAGYLTCDGTDVSRTTYAALFAAIGTSWGVGDGSTTFNLPDLRGRFMRGVDGGAGNDPDAAGRTALNGGATGDNVGSYQNDDVGPHDHPISVSLIDSSSGTDGGSGSGTWGISSPNTDFNSGLETRPKNANVNYIIKY
jgi:hypothetical protein